MRKPGVRVAVGGVILVGLLGVAFLVGPRAGFEDRWLEPDLPADLDAYLERSEASVPGVRPGAAKGIVWADPDTREPTRLALVYMHGFSADRQEVEPLVTELAGDLGANAYFTRLRGHGRDGAAMGEATVEAWLDDTSEAVAIGAAIGDSVILVGTSTGGTLALWAATRPEADGRIASLVLVSPNLGVQDPTAPILLWPWGGAIARVVVGPERCFEPTRPLQERHWTTCYPPRALLPMMALVDHIRSLEAGVLDVPTLVVYSSGDRIVDPAETQRVVERLSDGSAVMRAVEGAGDPDQHVIAGEIMSPETTEVVRSLALDFLEPLATGRVAR
jgi:alpha-beta hydrolase superfamily lysophospholipase